MEIEKMFESVVSPVLGRAIANTFALMAIAEEEIEVAKVGKASDLFLALCPGEQFVGLAPQAYRHHARELCSRYRLGEELKSGTMSEVLIEVLAMATVHPLSGGHARLAEFCFEQVFGKLPDKGDFGRESWPGETQELLLEWRKKLSKKRS